ncbi:uncharacterized protein BT62DRAFT_920326 [Guyanagaster necrorhizus]|uniref:Uncharacterized protein n=1 Tax=Guyanagaster necrorhizus TaxID=856835 RepID=A0A9P7VRR2_9AGAR|nr:uncharacterized protein BT62DRAFT_920326 [Guyanagaster necrorhizus MCA 3950]KAG7445622.1 hypothetical protein BT62DRAFT_920326 [Guyanagaster necrorhizus MCA 3950]
MTSPNPNKQPTSPQKLNLAACIQEIVKRKREDNPALDLETRIVASQDNKGSLFQDPLLTMKMKISQRTSSASPPPPLPPPKPMGLLTMPGTLSMPLRWLGDPATELLEVSLLAPTSPSEPAQGWAAPPSTIKSSDNERSKGSGMSCSQYIQSQKTSMSSRGERPCSMMSAIKTGSERWKGLDWQGQTSVIGMDSTPRSPVSSHPYKLTSWPQPTSSGSPVPQAVEFWSIGPMAQEPDNMGAP